MVEDIENRLNQALTNIKELDFIPNVPIFLKDMRYLFEQYRSDLRLLTPGEELRNADKFYSIIVDYCKILVTKFMKYFYDIDIVIEKNEQYALSSSVAVYVKEDDKIYYSTIGMILGNKRDMGCIQVFLHEAYHKVQHEATKVDSMDGLLKFPPSVLLEIKEELLINPVRNKDVYKENYNKLYTETAAQYNSIEMFKNIFYRMTKAYKNYCAEKGIEYDAKVENDCGKLSLLAQEIAKEIVTDCKSIGQLDNEIIKELHSIIIGSHYVIDGEEVDRLITLDKNIKAHPELKEKIPVLKILFGTNYKPKTYDELKEEKMRLLGKINVQEYSIVSDLFRTILLSDPMLYLNALIETNDFGGITAFFEKHPTLVDEYRDEISSLIVKCRNDSISELLKEKCQGTKMDY